MDDPAALLLVLCQVAEAHGKAEAARRAELGEKTLFKALPGNGNPTIGTVRKVPHAHCHTRIDLRFPRAARPTTG